MKRIFYPSGWLLTSNEIADAVLDYSRELRSKHEVDDVDLPVIDYSGHRSTEHLTVGWDTPLIAIPDPSAGPELRASGVVEGLRRCIASGSHYGKRKLGQRTRRR